jgi:hypothetical protein
MACCTCRPILLLPLMALKHIPGILLSPMAPMHQEHDKSTGPKGHIAK